jgi:putative transport protein
MHILNEFGPTGFVARGLATLSLAVTLGLILGAIRVRGFKLGISGVLFSALVFGQFGLTVDADVLSFLRDFSLILFIYTIGLQVGPGFVDSLKAEGLRLNMLAIAVLVLGGVMTAGVVTIAHLRKSMGPGLYAGAFTTTAGLAAGQEALGRMFSSDAVRDAGLAYAVTYPFGIIGPVLTIALFKRLLGVKVEQELAASRERSPRLTVLDIEITRTELAGALLKDLDFVRRNNILFSRILHEGKVSVPMADTAIAVGDIVRAIGAKVCLEGLLERLGRVSPIDLATISSDVSRVDLVVTRTAVLRKPLRQLDLTNRLGVTLARVNRVGVELVPNASFGLHFGDVVSAIGPPAGLAAVEQELGNSPDMLNRPQLMPIFLGIALGVLVGSIPIAVPGLQGGIKLGLASGPMMVAIVLSRFGNIGSVVWYMPAAANQLFRDFGLAVFLACVGLQQGDHYIQNLLGSGGLILVAWGAVITVLPVFLVGLFARWKYKMNFVTLSGWIAGAMTSSPALLYAGEVTQSDAAALAYAAVAPLAMIVPILCCQFLAAVR